MPVHKVMRAGYGDQRFAFDSADEKAVEAAMERFTTLTTKEKMWAAVPGENGAPGKVVKSFDPAVDVVFMPQLIGG